MSVADEYDIRIRQTDKGDPRGACIFDINIDSDGDFERDDTFNTPILLSLFVDGRADGSEISDPINRRGFWGDVILFKNEPNIGSGGKLWLISGRRTENTLNQAIDAVQKSLNWLLINKFAKQANVEGSFTTNGIILDVIISVDDNVVEIFNFKLWENGIVEQIERLAG